MLISTIRVDCFNIDSLTVSWTYDDSSQSNEYTVDIYRGETIGEFEKISSQDASDIQTYVDYGINLRNKYTIYYYKIHLVNKTTLVETVSNPAFLTYEPDYIALTLISKYNLVLHNLRFGGRKCEIYIRKTDGPRCPICWDPIKFRKIKDNCEACYATGFNGGFYAKIDSYFIISPELKESTLTVWGTMSPSDKIGWMSSYPLVFPGCIIKEKRINRMWRVNDRVQIMEKSGYPVKQLMSITEVYKTDIEYTLGNKNSDGN